VFAWQRRKGWDILLKAFIERFGDNPEVSLVIKASPFTGGQIGEERIRQEVEEAFSDLCGRNVCLAPRVQSNSQDGFIQVGKQPRNVFILFKQLNTTEVSSLYRNADAFVLPSRSEGWGRPYMEAMLHGLPVIGTNFGGQLDFMTVNNSFLINHKVSALKQSAQDEYKLNVKANLSGHRWAEPDVLHLKDLMSTVVKDSQLSSLRGKRAREDILKYYTPEHIARSMQTRVQHISSTLLSCPCAEGECNYWKQGKTLIHDGKYSAALACLREHLRVSSNHRSQWTKVEDVEDAELLYDLGFVFYKLDRVVTASRTLKQVSFLDRTLFSLEVTKFL